MLRGYDPLKENSQWRAIVSLLVGELILVGIALSPTYNSLYFTTFKWYGVPFWILPLLYIIFAIAFPPLNYFSYKRENLRREALRQEVLEGTDHLLASRQPLVSSEYSLPLTAKRQLKPFTLIGSVIYVLLALAFCALAVIMAFSSSWRVPAFLAIGVYGVSGLTAFLPLYVNPPIHRLITQYYLHPSLQADANGITAYYGRETVTMRWQDVRYFALTSSATLGKELTTTDMLKREAYEICDGENIICWIGATWRGCNSREDNSWLVEGISWPRSNTGPFEWDKQTEALPSLIVAKTGLPLYDLCLPAQKRANQLRECAISSARRG